MAIDASKTKRFIRATAIASALAGFLPCADAQTPAGVASAAQADGELFERYAERAQISGAVLAGIVFSGTPSPQRPALSARIPQSWGGEHVCVRLVSIDGRYVARQTYRIAADWSGGALSLPFATRYARPLADLSPAEMAVSVSKGVCETAGELSIAGWNSASESDTVFLLVNSFGADEAYLFVENESADIACEPVRDVNHLAYDFRCPVPAGSFWGTGTVKVEVDRVRAGGVDEPEVFKIARTAG